jgi:hypothetical protein
MLAGKYQQKIATKFRRISTTVISHNKPKRQCTIGMLIQIFERKVQLSFEPK